VGTAQIANLAVGSAQIADLAVNTLQIAGQAVTVPAFLSNNGNDITLVYTLSGTPGLPYSVFIQVGLTCNVITGQHFSIDGAHQWDESVAGGTILSKAIAVTLTPGTYTFRAWTDAATTGASIYVLATKR
jgi:hypothetical protein